MTDKVHYIHILHYIQSIYIFTIDITLHILQLTTYITIDISLVVMTLKYFLIALLSFFAIIT